MQVAEQLAVTQAEKQGLVEFTQRLEVEVGNLTERRDALAASDAANGAKCMSLQQQLEESQLGRTTAQEALAIATTERRVLEESNRRADVIHAERRATDDGRERELSARAAALMQERDDVRRELSTVKEELAVGLATRPFS